MSDPPPQPRPQPPPLPQAPAPGVTPAVPNLPPRPVGYVMPGAQVGPTRGQMAQKVFDTVAGPNLRLRDNLIQLAAVIVGAGAGGVIGWVLSPTSHFNDAYLYTAGGVLVGLIVSVVVSGVTIGIIRGRDAMRR